MKKIKVTPRKSDTLCGKCKFGYFNSKCKRCSLCRTCKIKKALGSCACEDIEYGEPCKYFEKEEENNEKD